MTECYELIDVKVKSELIQARPIAWDREIFDGFGNDVNGNPVLATEFHATCPYCANLIHFTINDIHKDGFGDGHIRCLNCCTVDELIIPEEKFQQDEKVQNEEVKPNYSVFIDPIAEGIFDVEINNELLNKLESAKSN